MNPDPRALIAQLLAHANDEALKQNWLAGRSRIQSTEQQDLVVHVEDPKVRAQLGRNEYVVFSQLPTTPESITPAFQPHEPGTSSMQCPFQPRVYLAPHNGKPNSGVLKKQPQNRGTPGSSQTSLSYDFGGISSRYEPQLVEPPAVLAAELQGLQQLLGAPELPQADVNIDALQPLFLAAGQGFVSDSSVAEDIRIQEGTEASVLQPSLSATAAAAPGLGPFLQVGQQQPAIPHNFGETNLQVLPIDESCLLDPMLASTAQHFPEDHSGCLHVQAPVTANTPVLPSALSTIRMEGVCTVSHRHHSTRSAAATPAQHMAVRVIRWFVLRKDLPPDIQQLLATPAQELDRYKAHEQQQPLLKQQAMEAGKRFTKKPYRWCGTPLWWIPYDLYVEGGEGWIGGVALYEFPGTIINNPAGRTEQQQQQQCQQTLQLNLANIQYGSIMHVARSQAQLPDAPSLSLGSTLQANTPAAVAASYADPPLPSPLLPLLPSAAPPPLPPAAAAYSMALTPLPAIQGAASGPPAAAACSSPAWPQAAVTAVVGSGTAEMQDIYSRLAAEDIPVAATHRPSIADAGADASALPHTANSTGVPVTGASVLSGVPVGVPYSAAATSGSTRGWASGVDLPWVAAMPYAQQQQQHHVQLLPPTPQQHQQQQEQICSSRRAAKQQQLEDLHQQMSLLALQQCHTGSLLQQTRLQQPVLPLQQLSRLSKQLNASCLLLKSLLFGVCAGYCGSSSKDLFPRILAQVQCHNNRVAAAETDGLVGVDRFRVHIHRLQEKRFGRTLLHFLVSEFPAPVLVPDGSVELEDAAAVVQHVRQTAAEAVEEVETPVEAVANRNTTSRTSRRYQGYTHSALDTATVQAATCHEGKLPGGDSLSDVARAAVTAVQAAATQTADSQRNQETAGSTGPGAGALAIKRGSHPLCPEHRLCLMQQLRQAVAPNNGWQELLRTVNSNGASAWLTACTWCLPDVLRFMVLDPAFDLHTDMLFPTKAGRLFYHVICREAANWQDKSRFQEALCISLMALANKLAAGIAASTGQCGQEHRAHSRQACDPGDLCPLLPVPMPTSTTGSIIWEAVPAEACVTAGMTQAECSAVSSDLDLMNCKRQRITSSAQTTPAQLGPFAAMPHCHQTAPQQQQGHHDQQQWDWDVVATRQPPVVYVWPPEVLTALQQQYIYHTDTPKYDTTLLENVVAHLFGFQMQAAGNMQQQVL